VSIKNRKFGFLDKFDENSVVVLCQGKWIKFLDKTEGSYILTVFDPERSYYAAFFKV
jgi:hypothetical protein